MVNRAITAVGGQAAFEILSVAIEFMKIHQAEETQREYIRARRDALVTALNNERDLLLDYFDRRFNERRSALEEFFSLLHHAVDSGNIDELQAALTGILGILKDNPLGDLAEFRGNWSNPDYSIDL